MTAVNPEFVEKYQILLQKDPKSKVFAPLAEAYRKMGWVDEALEVCSQGVKHNPHFPGGRVALAKVYVEKEDYAAAVRELERAVELSPENILAYSLLADSLLRLKRPKEALKAYKMVLFLSPDNEKAQNAVKKLESLTADEYEDDVFSMQPLGKAVRKIHGEEAVPLEPLPRKGPDPKESQILERYLSLADAFIVRGDLERASQSLDEVERLFGDHPDIHRRMRLIHQRHLDEDEEVEEEVDLTPEPPLRLNREERVREAKIEYLQGLLGKIKT